MTYLLDTDTCIGMMRGVAPKTIARASLVDSVEIGFSSIVRFELLTGALRSLKPAAELLKIEKFSSGFTPLFFDDHCASETADIRSYLEARSLKIGPYDTLIAGMARAHGLIVVTRNVSEFGRVPNLRIEDWEK